MQVYRVVVYFLIVFWQPQEHTLLHRMWHMRQCEVTTTKASSVRTLSCRIEHKWKKLSLSHHWRVLSPLFAGYVYNQDCQQLHVGTHRSKPWYHGLWKFNHPPNPGHHKLLGWVKSVMIDPVRLLKTYTSKCIVCPNGLFFSTTARHGSLFFYIDGF